MWRSIFNRRNLRVTSRSTTSWRIASPLHHAESLKFAPSRTGSLNFLKSLSLVKLNREMRVLCSTFCAILLAASSKSEELPNYLGSIFPLSLFFPASFLTCNQRAENRNLGKLMQFLINEQNIPFYGMKLPTGFQLIGQTQLKHYQAWLDYFDRQSKIENDTVAFRTTKRAYARVGVSPSLSVLLLS